MLPFLMLVIVGAAAGFVATRILGVELGLVPTIAVGILGAVIGGLVLQAVVTAFALLGGFVGAVLGAILLIWLWQRYGAGRL